VRLIPVTTYVAIEVVTYWTTKQPISWESDYDPYEGEACYHAFGPRLTPFLLLLLHHMFNEEDTSSCDYMRHGLLL